MYRQQNSYLIPHYQVRLIPEIHQYILPIHATLLKKELLELDFSQGVPKNMLCLNYSLLQGVEYNRYRFRSGGITQGPEGIVRVTRE